MASHMASHTASRVAGGVASRVFELIALIFVVLLFGLQAAAAADPMAPADIRTTFFNGQPFTATSPSGTKFTMIFMPDGR
jgi:hypothetical protein